MNSRKFAAIFLCIFVLGAFPLIIVQSYGAISAGLSAGFVAFLKDLPALSLYLVCGLAAVFSGILSVMVLPVCTILAFMAGAGLEMGAMQFPYLKLFILAWVSIFAAAAYLMQSKRFMVFALTLGVLGFMTGGNYVLNIGDALAPVPYLFGGAICALLISGIGICIGITMNEFMQSSVEKLKNAPATSFLTWLL